MSRVLPVAVSALGLALRLEHALTFDAVKHGADYERHISGVMWMMRHWRPFDFTPALDLSISYQAPLWYAAAAAVVKLTGSLRAIAGLAVAGWIVRQALLARLLRRAIPGKRGAILIALTIHAFLPISVLTDGEANPEVLHTTLFTAAVYVLWRMEREAQTHGAIHLLTAGVFGGLAGLATLAKGTASVLPMAAAVVLGWQARRLVLRKGWRAVGRDVARPALVAAGVWCLIAGWWCGPNLVNYGHPFPHAWNHTFPAELQSLAAVPASYRRPLGWALPLFWGPYWSEPFMRNADTPRTNLWAMLMAGTWSDLINRGFCRLQGGGIHLGYWDGWPVSHRCLILLRTLFRAGCLVAAAAVLAIVAVFRSHLRTDGQAGSLALPTVIVLGVAFPALFALTYPVDGMAVVNARYLLPVSTAMSACLGIGLAAARPRRVAHGLMGMAAVVVVALVTFERWGR